MAFLESLNLQLAQFEREQYDLRKMAYPLILVIGAPRSGTTILTQCIAYATGAGFITNIAARFWMAPVTGVRVSREIVSDDPRPGFTSRYARTPEPENIHEFGYFWKCYLDESGGAGIYYELSHVLRNLVNVFGRPVVMKGIWPAYHADVMNAIFGDKIVWVFVRRDEKENVDSLMRAYRDTGRQFFGWPLPRPFDVSRMTTRERAETSVRFFNEYYAGLADLTIGLDGLRRDPNAEVARIGLPLVRKIPLEVMR